VSFQQSPREGAIFSASQLEQACLAQLQRLLPAYGNAVAAQLGATAPAPPRSYTCAARFDRWAEDQLPAVVVVSPGTLRQPELHGGAYDAVFGLVVGIYCSAATERATHDLVRLWCAALRACLLQTASLGGVVADLMLLDESYDEIDVESRRSIAAGVCGFEAHVNAITDRRAGPLVAASPPDDQAWPLVQTADVEIDRLPEEAA
jgi:hypothetical protein